jgi:alpha-beta hydrolase superfamily lysophospholipase
MAQDSNKAPDRYAAQASTRYGNDAFWNTLNNCLPESLRLSSQDLPEEDTIDLQGFVLHIDRYRNATADAQIILHHGIGTNARILMTIVGRALASRGYDVAAIDLPYFTASKNRNSSTTYQDWVNLSVQFVEREHLRHGKPIVLFGFSVGGMLAYHVACLSSYVRGVAGTCFLDLSDRLVRREISPSAHLQAWFEFFLRPASRIFGDVRIPLRWIAKTNRLTNDPAITSRLLVDESSLTGRIPLRFVRSLGAYRAAVAPEDFNFCPIKLFHMEDDQWTSLSASRRFLDRLPVDVETELIKDAGHLPVSEGALRQLADGVADFVENTVLHDTSLPSRR